MDNVIKLAKELTGNEEEGEIAFAIGLAQMSVIRGNLKEDYNIKMVKGVAKSKDDKHKGQYANFYSLIKLGVEPEVALKGAIELIGNATSGQIAYAMDIIEDKGSKYALSAIDEAKNKK